MHAKNGKQKKIEKKKEEKEEAYKRKKEETIQIMEKTEAEEIEGLINKKGQEKLNFWKTIKQIKRKEMEGKEGIEDINGKVTKDKEEILNIKREYYKNLYRKDMTVEEIEREKEYEQELENAFTDMSENYKDYNQDFTMKEIHESIKEIKTNKDGITNEMLKHGGVALKREIIQVCNEILFEREEQPNDWRMGEIISIFKGKGKKTHMKYQRGITLTSCILKLIERIIGNRIGLIIKENSTPLQGGGKKMNQ